MRATGICEECQSPSPAGGLDICPTCLLREALAAAREESSPTSPPVDPLIGARVSSYEVRGLIGSGGMGRVYRARHLTLDRQVAIKVLNPEQLADPDRKRRFLREAKAASSLNHANIVTVFDLVRDGEREFLVMEYVDGPSLAEVLERGPLPRRRALRYARHIAAALSAAHRVGVVHRDTKPSNVVIAEGDVAKLLDFGLAKLVGGAGGEASSLALTGDGTVIGTVHYMSPEQALGHAVDHRSDIFSFGALLFEMLSGRRAFEGDSAAAVLHAVAFAPPPPLPEDLPPLPSRLLALLGRALEKEPARRFESMEELLTLLEQLDEHDASAEQGWLPQLRLARGRRAKWAAALIVGALGLAFTFFILQKTRMVDVATPAPPTEKPTSVAAETPGPYADFQAGMHALERLDRPGHLDQAIASFHSAVDQDERFAAAYAGLARAQLEKYLIENRDPVWLRRSEANSEKAVELEPGLAAAHAIRALVLVRLGRLEEAQMAAATALGLNPLEAEAHRAEAELASARGKIDEAVRHLERAVELAPQNWRLHASLVEKLHAAGRSEEAVEACRAWLRLTPDNVHAHQTLGGLLTVLGDLDGASAALQSALEIRPEADVYSNLGTLLYFRGRYEKAAEQYRRAVELKPNQRIFWSNLGDALRQARDDDAAGEAYLRAIQLIRDALEARPDDGSLLSELAEAHAKRGESEETLEILGRIEKLAEPGPEVLFAAAKSYELAGARERALQALEGALEAGYSLSQVQLEPELLELRRDLRYHRLLTRRGR